MCSDVVISALSLGKRYQLYDAPVDRLKEFVLPRLRRMLGLPNRRYHREFTSLGGVSFEVRAGQTVGIVGRNGAGKSTLLQMLCGTLEPSDGSVEVRGRVAALLELGAGFNPEFSGRENVYMNGQLLGLTEEQISERFDAIVAFADIGDFLEQPVKTYSSGMYVRLAFAVIAHVDADILVIDEALAVGDAYFSQKCMRFLRGFKERGTLLFVSHDASAVVNLCDRAIWLDKGSLRLDGSAKEVMQSYLEELYAGSSAAQAATEPAAKDSKVAKTENPNVMAEGLPHVAAQTFSLEPVGEQNAGTRFGTGQARVANVRLVNVAGEPYQWVEGGERVNLEVDIHVGAAMMAPIVGFIVKDRLGQHLFGNNTFQSFAAAPQPCQAGGEVTANFGFTMPILPKGEYAVAVAIADGTQDEHVVHEWVHEALLFQSHSSSVVTGLVGIPMKDIFLRSHDPKGVGTSFVSQ